MNDSKMKIKLLITVLFLTAQVSFSQWSTSPYADSGLYICPGFYPGLITYNDGSSLILGALSGSIYARKLDTYGNFLWEMPKRLFLNDSAETDVGSALKQWYCSDGDGGAISLWYDYSGASVGSGDPGYYCNNSMFVQRIDKHGNIKWGNGIKIVGLETGTKTGRIANDDSGGCVIAWLEEDFDCTQATDSSRLRIARITEDGTITWEKTIATATNQNQLGIGALTRVKDRYFFQTNLGIYVIGENGSFIYTDPLQGIGRLLVYQDMIFNIKPTGMTFQDSMGINYAQNNIIKMNISLDTLWSKFFWLKSGTSQFSYYPIFICDTDNIYFGYTLYDSEDNGTYVYKLGIDINEWPIPTIVNDFVWLPTFGSSGDEGFVISSSTTYHTWRYDREGFPVWVNPVQMVSDSQNAYFGNFEPDNNGGMIVAYWTTQGGIFAKHSGRNGELGIVTSVPKELLTPEEFKLYQNYPNPFNPTTKINYSIPEAGHISLKVYNLLGEEVATLVDEYKQAGKYEVKFNAGNLSSGVYLYKLKANDFLETKKLILLK